MNQPQTKLDRTYLAVILPRNERIPASETVCQLPTYFGYYELHQMAEPAALFVLARPAHCHAWLIPCVVARG